MFEEKGSKSIGKGTNSAEKVHKPAPFDWKSLPIDLLIEYRRQIDAHLPPLSIKEIDLEKEMLLQYHGLCALQNQVINDDDLPLNQRAQVANSVAEALKQLLNRQESVYTSERYKSIENVLVRALSRLPEDVAAAFLKDYEALLDK